MSKNRGEKEIKRKVKEQKRLMQEEKQNKKSDEKSTKEKEMQKNVKKRTEMKNKVTFFFAHPSFSSFSFSLAASSSGKRKAAESSKWGPTRPALLGVVGMSLREDGIPSSEQEE